MASRGPLVASRTARATHAVSPRRAWLTASCARAVVVRRRDKIDKFEELWRLHEAHGSNLVSFFRLADEDTHGAAAPRGHACTTAGARTWWAPESAQGEV